MNQVRNEKELLAQLSEKKQTIEIEGSLATKVLRIKATGKIAWALVLGSISVAAAGTLLTPITGGMGIIAGLSLSPVALSILGIPATVTALSLAFMGKGVWVLNALRLYRVIKIGSTIKLIRGEA